MSIKNRVKKLEDRKPSGRPNITEIAYIDPHTKEPDLIYRLNENGCFEEVFRAEHNEESEDKNHEQAER
jgi:hypothetical protein